MDVEAFNKFGLELSTHESVVERLGEIACPVTVVVGELDPGLRAPAELMAERIPGAQLAVIPNTGHSPQEDDPAAWLAVIEAHLARARA